MRLESVLRSAAAGRRRGLRPRTRVETNESRESPVVVRRCDPSWMKRRASRTPALRCPTSFCQLVTSCSRLGSPFSLMSAGWLQRKQIGYKTNLGALPLTGARAQP